VRSMVGRAGPEKEGWERMEGRGRESGEGEGGFYSRCRLKHTGRAPNPIWGGKPEGAVHRYINNRLHEMGFCIELGHVDSAEEWWWRAVLALGQGWRANVQPPLFYSPWSVSYAGDPPFFMTSSTAKPSRRDL
jgi:hypothetical protein